MNSFSHLDIEKYSRLARAMSALSRLFGDSDQPYIPYRFAERLFLHCVSGGLNATDLSRADNSFDSMLSDNGIHYGVGVKTFVKSSTPYKDEKVAEFTKYAGTHNLKSLSGLDLAMCVSGLRNKRVSSDAGEYGISIEESIYHCLVRDTKCFFIHEEPYPLIDIENLRLTKSASSGTIAFTDGKNQYKYSTAKNVLLKRFDLTTRLSEKYPVEILKDPFTLLERLCLSDEKMAFIKETSQPVETREFIVLPLYKTRGTDHEVPARSGINQWNAGGRARTFGEAYIPVPKALLDARPKFFPIYIEDSKYKCRRFSLHLPNGDVADSKLCQENLKALMSDPNTKLIEWIYKTIDGSIEKAKERLDPYGKNRPYTREDLLAIGKDAVYVFKNSECDFSIQFAPLGAFDAFADSHYEKVPFSDFRLTAGL